MLLRGEGDDGPVGMGWTGDRPQGFQDDLERGTEQFFDERLTPTENKAAEMARNGYSNAEIAEEVGWANDVVAATKLAAIRRQGVDIPMGKRGQNPDKAGNRTDILRLAEQRLRPSQIAERLGKPVGTVKVTLSKARKALQDAGQEIPDWLGPRTDLVGQRYNGLGNAFAQSLMGGAGGSAYGSQNDINGDGVIDQQDVFIGSAAGTVGVPLAMGVAGRVGNAFAPGVRSMGAGAPKTPQQAMRAELPGSLEYEAAVAKGLDMSTPARMQRARDMGFDTENVAYRGMTREYDPAKAGNFQMFTSSPEDAGEFAGNGAFDGGNVVAAYLRKGRNLQVNGGGNNFNSVPVSQLPADVRAKLHPSIGSVARTDEIAYAAKQAGYDSVSIKNVFDNAQGEIPRKPRPPVKDDVDALLAELEAGGFNFDEAAKFAPEIAPDIPRNYDPVTVDVIFDPANIRSVHAAFDPDKAASPILTAGLGGGGRKPPPDSPEAITDAVRGIARETPPSQQNAFVPPRGNMRGVLQMPERVPPASPMADQVPPPLPPRPVSNRVPTSNMPNATEIGLAAGTGAAIGGAFLMEKANDPATFGLASFDELPEGHPLRDPQYRQMALMAQMQPQQPQRGNAFAR